MRHTPVIVFAVIVLSVVICCEAYDAVPYFPPRPPLPGLEQKFFILVPGIRAQPYVGHSSSDNSGQRLVPGHEHEENPSLVSQQQERSDDDDHDELHFSADEEGDASTSGQKDSPLGSESQSQSNDNNDAPLMLGKPLVGEKPDSAVGSQHHGVGQEDLHGQLDSDKIIESQDEEKIGKGGSSTANSDAADVASFIWDLFKGESTHELTHSIHDFTQAFLAQVLSTDSGDSNLVFSPLSLHATLAMLASGASNGSDTQKQLLKTLLGSSRNLPTLEQGYQKLLDEYRNFDDTFRMGNKIWTATNISANIKEDFVDHLNEVYQAAVEGLREENPTEQVNKWIRKVTKGKIDSLFDELSPDAVLVLTNAIYFKDSWTAPFEDLYDEADLAAPQFYLLDGTEVTEGVDRMTRSSYDLVSGQIQFDGIPNRNFVTVAIPYETENGERFEMVLLMPEDRPSDILILENHIKMGTGSFDYSNNIFDQLDWFLRDLGDSEEVQVNLVMPTFSVSSDLGVKKILERMGLSAAFSSGDFNRMSDSPLAVSKVKHKAIVDVDRQGTVGAAATGGELTPLSGFTDFKPVRIDKPFFFIIRDKHNGVPLFVGKVMDPRQ